VLHARFDTPQGPLDGFAKPFTMGDETQATQTLNEVTGWLVARACGLPVPKRAFFAALKLSELPAYSGPRPLPVADQDGCVVCFVTQAVANTAQRSLFNTKALVLEQSRWAHCNDTIAFDEGLANADRHSFNLMRSAENDFVLIDHGQLLFDPCQPRYPMHWPAGEIEARTLQPFANLLHQNTYPYLGRNARSACQQGADASMAFGLKMAKAMQRVFFELAFWCSKLLPGKSARWLEFLYTRNSQRHMQQLLQTRYGLFNIHA
jgi:hypothetical protein